VKIIIYSQNLVSMDGVGNSSIYFKNLLKSFVDVELVANYSNINGVVNFKEYIKKHNYNNILFYHYSIEDINLKILLKLKFKKRIIFYHGITPPKFFSSGSELFNNCKQGLSDINLLHDFDLYISNSTESKNQFFNKLNNNSIDYENFIVMPPIDLFLKDKKDYKNKSLKSELNFYYCGTLSNHKNVNLLLDIFNKNQNNQLKLSIFTSSSKEDCLNYLGECKYREFSQNRIIFFHKLEDERLNNDLRNMNCFITFSLHEGFCIPLFNSIDNFNPSLSFPLKCLEDYFPKEYKYISNTDDFGDIQKKYFYNLEHINQFRNFIKDQVKRLTERGLDSIRKIIES
tara:strand:+ start:316 stop:1344 length:1029 start_codon:yes stop_codon:yes gene_type:complete